MHNAVDTEATLDPIPPAQLVEVTNDKFLVFSGERGFWQSDGRYGTDRRFYKVFSFKDAVAFCKRRRNNLGEVQAMPVPEFAYAAVISS